MNLLYNTGVSTEAVFPGKIEDLSLVFSIFATVLIYKVSSPKYSL